MVITSANELAENIIEKYNFSCLDVDTFTSHYIHIDKLKLNFKIALKLNRVNWPVESFEYAAFWSSIFSINLKFIFRFA